MSSYKSDSFWQLYEIGGADLALRYHELSDNSSSSSSHSTNSIELKIESLRFYAVKEHVPAEAERSFGTRFARKGTKFVYFQLDMINPWEYTTFTYTITARYYKPDGTLMGEVKNEVETQPSWRRFWHTDGWGNRIIDVWQPGTYRVEILVDGEARISERFTIYEDEPVMPIGQGFDAWMGYINKQFPSRVAPKQRVPSDDLGKMKWFNDVNSRYMQAMVLVRPGKVTPKVTQDLYQIAQDYEALREASPPLMMAFLFDAKKIEEKIADTHTLIAQANAILHDYNAARQHYTTAIQMYQKLGNNEMVARYQTALERLDTSQSGNVDKELVSLQNKLMRVAKNSIEQADVLIELGSLYRRNGDNFEAKKRLLEAEKILQALSDDPSGTDIANAFASSMMAMSEGKGLGNQGLGNLQAVMKANGLYRVLYVELSRVYQASGNAKKAAHYRALATQRDSRETNDEFSQEALKALQDLL